MAGLSDHLRGGQDRLLLSLILYDSMLTDITDRDRMDNVSSQGYAWGYIGSCVPFLLCLALVLGSGVLGISMTTAMLLSFVIVALWWVIASLPLLRAYRQRHYVHAKAVSVGSTFSQLGQSLREISRDKTIFLFLIAFFFYIDGVYTIIDMATAYGSALGLDTTGLLLALLVTQIVAFPSAICIGRLARKILLRQPDLPVYCGLFSASPSLPFFLSNILQFWMLAVLVGLFRGASRPCPGPTSPNSSRRPSPASTFGLLDICGKGPLCWAPRWSA